MNNNLQYGRKINFNTEMENTIQSIEQEREKNGVKKPTLFLHACCAPCSSSCLERVSPFFDITVYFYNPNIHPEAEYIRRRDEILSFVKEFNARDAVIKNDAKNVDGENSTNQNVGEDNVNDKIGGNPINIIEDKYDVQDYYDAVRIDLNPELAQEKEKGERCRRCYEFRMKRAFAIAESKGFDYFATTLTLSPLKDSEKVNEIGRLLNENAEATGEHVRYLYSDFKKKNGYLRSLELSKEYGLYRQTYCGCVYSMQNR